MARFSFIFILNMLLGILWLPAGATVLVGEDQTSWDYPLHTYWMDSRTQSIYTPEEIGTAGIIEQVALYVNVRPGQDLNHFHLRLKHTSQAEYAGGYFDNTGLVTVLSLDSVDVSLWDVPGWVTFDLDADFSYNGSDNLLVDWVVDNASWTSSGTVAAGYDSTRNCTVYAHQDIPGGDLLDATTGDISQLLPQLRLLGTIRKPVSGWVSSAVPWVVTSDLLVDSTSTLTLPAGVDVQFAGPYGIRIQGCLRAPGTETSPVLFHPAPGNTEWGNLWFDHPEENSAPVSELRHCIFSHSFGTDAGAILLEYADSTVLEYCRFDSCRSNYYLTGVIRSLETDLAARHLEFRGTTWATNIKLISSNWTVDHLFMDNPGDASVYAAAAHSSSLAVHNGTIVNIAGFYLSRSSVSLYSTIMWNINGYNAYLYGYYNGWYWETSDFNINYCNLENGLNAYFDDYYENASENHLLSLDPRFADPDADDYRLTAESPCIDTGYPEDPADPDGTPQDMGCYQYAQQLTWGTPIWGEVQGTWDLYHSPYLVYGDLLVPHDSTLTIGAGVEIRFQENWSHNFRVEGAVLAEGTAEAPITWHAAEPDSGWTGCTIDSWSTEGAHSSRFNYCDFQDANYCLLYFNIYDDTLFVENSTISHCRGKLLYGSGMNTTAVIRNVVFRDNTSDQHLIYVEQANFSMEKCVLVNNQAQDSPLLFYLNYAPAVSPVLLDRCTIMNLETEAPAIIELYGANDFHFANGIIWGTESFPVYFTGGGSWDENAAVARFQYSDISGLGQVDEVDLTYGHPLLGAGLLEADPLFADAAAGDVHLTAGSPCIDAAMPSLPQDPDYTPADMGAWFFNQAAPEVTQVADVPNDQGHQVFLVWNAGSLDLQQYEYGTFYSLWRQDETGTRFTGGLVYSDPGLALRENPQARPGELFWQSRDQVWTYLGQVPASHIPQYSAIVPTLADSTAGDPHTTLFRAIYHGLELTAVSNELGGCSVDNIPPDEVTGLRCEPQTGRPDLLLAWDPVTTGTWQGNRYPELNGVWYRVYGSETPWFACDGDHYLGTTTQTSWPVTGAPRHYFYRVVASDTE